MLSLASVSRKSYWPDKNKSGKLTIILSRTRTPYWKHRFFVSFLNPIFQKTKTFLNPTKTLAPALLIHFIFHLQEEFRAKQANIFAALDKLYILHNAILAESRFIKAFFYCCVVFLIYMLTSAKQTFSIRGRLYFGTISTLFRHTSASHFVLTNFVAAGLCITLALEMGLIKIGADDFDKQFWVMSKVFLVRMVFMGLATVQLLHSIFTYR